MTGPQRDGGAEAVGSAAEEAARLFAAVSDWARDRGQGTAGEHAVGDATTCGVCPVCSGIALLRDVRPETVEHLLDAAASLVAAVRSAVLPTGPDQGHDRAHRVEHIDVREG